MADKFEVARALREIALLLEVDGANPFKIRAYERGARAVEVLREDVTALAREGRLTEVPGIGAALASTITEIATTGRSAQLEKLKSRLPSGVLELAPVLSLPKIKAVHDALGISTLDELKAAAEAGRLRSVAGFGEKTEAKVLAAINGLAERTNGETLLYEATREAESVLEHVRAAPAVEKAEAGGALRRRCETVTGIEVVVGSSEPAAVPTTLPMPAGITLKIEVVPPAQFAAALHRSTGTAGHRAKLAVVAESRGLRLDDEGLMKAGKRLAIATEEDLYRHLDLPYIPPEMREDAGEVEAAVMGTLPVDLVTHEDVRGLVHCHTTYSDGKHSVLEMARAAEKLGMKYITITDHSPTAHYARGLPLDRLKKQWEDIDRAQEQVSVRLLRGTESDINADGSLDYPDEVLEKLDVIIASVHNRHKMDSAGMTKRITTAMRKKQFKVWGHALGRYVLTRPPFACDVERILDVIAESRAAVEINGDPHRLDMEPRWIREARKRDIKFVISTDAHSMKALENFRWGVDMARRGWVRKGEVLNTMDVDGFRYGRPPMTPLVFLLSPASTGGERARIIFREQARFDLALQLRTPEGALLGDVFSFLSGLYFRGKLTYARVFARPPAGAPGVLVITPSEGLRSPDILVTLDRLLGYSKVPIDLGEKRYREPLMRDAKGLFQLVGPECDVVLLGSVATGKYVEPLTEVFGRRLLFPADFVGRGDMSRGGLLLRAAADRRELVYEPIAGVLRHGARPQKLVPRPGILRRAMGAVGATRRRGR